ncbi:hypothetical protein VNO78_19342 [Psophocarpus tetragonolobus]|uniref:Uncharacterized protein n=1 Tax=Psophocarpus tetragonolobus TaxID=3891 RepID=A0AAN9S7H7_PSOTE
MDYAGESNELPFIAHIIMELRYPGFIEGRFLAMLSCRVTHEDEDISPSVLRVEGAKRLSDVAFHVRLSHD